ncbi:SET domain-containing protein-lysine N-methyltransferase [Legionella cardiaca]|uniref:SET domain-containing protein-lysine N-methyltransferase n=1 Tax=Legionella cardiaca TaxID=1071983 RepID=A0ABY8AVA5_9GAMM|nr:SET domain-containing protein-lysine N-methyltransferase [Legionella cardiaca]WED44513.1 SET domain-containing protein-lysine N-methyltransferase [Legionella cardiaca]
MVKIILTNHNKQSPFKKAVLDVSSKICEIDESQKGGFQLLQNLDFQHPLLSYPYLKSSTTTYHYHYHDMAGLLETAKYVYATLLHASKPEECQFVVSPSPHFLSLKAIYKIPFSLDDHKEAKDFITVNQINGIISQLANHQFHFHDKLIINDTILFKNLPETVDGDALFAYNDKAYELLNKEEPFELCEIRYINQFIGFGVYARKDIKKGTNVCVYQGMKTNPESKRYHFYPHFDLLGLGIDATDYGNIGRFVNHAPSSSQPDHFLLDVNLMVDRHILNGIEIVAFTAKRDIAKNEQLFVDYGAGYFENAEEYRFNREGKLLNPKGEILLDKHHEKLNTLRVMAKNGVSQAAYRLLKRPLLALLLTALGFIALYSIQFL